MTVERNRGARAVDRRDRRTDCAPENRAVNVLLDVRVREALTLPRAAAIEAKDRAGYPDRDRCVSKCGRQDRCGPVDDCFLTRGRRLVPSARGRPPVHGATDAVMLPS